MAANRMGRNSIAIELDPNDFLTASQRIHSTLHTIQGGA